MKDPHPSKISGEKVQRHIVKWNVNVSQVALAIVALVLLWKLSGMLGSSDGGGGDPGVGAGVDEDGTSSPW
jgi:hypothetical protein